MKGAIENCCRAEQEIMKKVREAYENDVAAMSVSARQGPTKHPSLNLSKAAMGGVINLCPVLCGWLCFWT